MGCIDRSQNGKKQTLSIKTKAKIDCHCFSFVVSSLSCFDFFPPMFSSSLIQHTTIKGGTLQIFERVKCLRKISEKKN